MNSTAKYLWEHHRVGHDATVRLIFQGSVDLVWITSLEAYPGGIWVHPANVHPSMIPPDPERWRLTWADLGQLGVELTRLWKHSHNFVAYLAATKSS
jgi:hypothetical protein